MKKELMIFSHQEVLGKIFTIYGDLENPMFLAKDVAVWIDYSYKDSRKIHRDVSKMLQSVDEDEKEKCTLNLCGEDCFHGGVGANTEMWFLTEYGFYQVLMESNKPIAKVLKKEVMEILRTIRQHHAYLTAPTLRELLKDHDRVIEMLQILKEERSEAKLKENNFN